MTETAGGDFHRVVLLVPGAKVAGDFTLSVFVKPAERHALQFEMTEAKGHYGVALFDLVKKQVVTETGDIEDAGIQELPGGWFRCWAVMSYKSTSPAFNITVLADSLAVEYSGSDGEGLYIWGPQFEAASEIHGYSTK